MRLLYAIQATGNGHLTRSLEIIPHLQKHCKVDVLVSGNQSLDNFPIDTKFKYKGLSYSFGKNGRIHIAKSLLQCNILRFCRDVLARNVEDYDLVINDFEPVSAWACKIKDIPIIGLGHQASFFSRDVPRPGSRSWVGEFVLKTFAPVDHHLGLHFDKYSENIASPIIRRGIRNAQPEERDHISVYLPAYGDEEIQKVLRQFPKQRFHVFSKYVANNHRLGNIDFFKESKKEWVDSLRTAKGVVMGAGFEGPSEALYLGKRLYVIPMGYQYEQRCNAAALANLGVWVGKDLQNSFTKDFGSWVNSEAVQIPYVDNVDELANRVIEYGKALKALENPALVSI